MTWNYTWTGATNTTGYYVMPLTYGSGSQVPSAPKPTAPKPTALEWLDAEVERTCALARPS